MKVKRQIIYVAMIAIALSFFSCSQRIVDFTVISSKNHSIGFEKSTGKRVKGKSTGFLGIGANIKDAMDNALQSAGPEYDVLVDGVVKVENYFFVSGYTVEGTAVNSGGLKAALGEQEFSNWMAKSNVFDPNAVVIEE
ncbi:MAG: hypothetical protein JJU34_08565 [Lunatimonas sp.]|uniref:hypothetical protein n=1 Tax=Lunatimonas sp. TaxID=2060141 RepID=UPI00263B1598|nr:hypothetical protein [Lunatimonas sp.]MCC5937320.1 hypothetical protein [Lunatimonas sp.]